MTTPRLPVDFVQQMQAELGTALPEFLEAIQQDPPVSIRLNPGKPGTPYDDALLVPWHPHGRYLPERPVFTLDPLFHAGTYYVQEASSMLIGAALQQLLELNRPLKALDLCGAPGGKSTLLAGLLSSDSLLLANEVIAARSKILRENLTKWGQTNTFWSQHDSKDFQPLQGYFDLILVDAPCSGEGLFRKTPEATLEWSPEHVQHCSARQKRILGDACQLLAPGGILLYSTCTYNPIENTENAHWLESQGLSYEPLNLPSSWGIVEKERGYQCYPHLVKGEGFYLAAFRAPSDTKSRSIKIQAPKHWQKLSKKDMPLLEDWVQDFEQFSVYQNAKGALYLIPQELEASVLALKSVLPRLGVPSPIGNLSKGLLLPEHGLAVSQVLPDTLPTWEVDEPTAIQFLRKENMARPERIANGWTLVQHQGHTLGWIKVIQNRINNYYPKNWRIRMEA